jgi:hypothetical protein
MAKKDLFYHVDLNQNELRNFTCEKLATDPTPFEGQIWENTTDKRLKVYLNGTIQTIAHLSDVTSAVKFKGGYDAATNTPDLDSTPIATLTGDLYYVTAAGTFFTTAVEIGDVLISNIDNATTLADWTIVQANIGAATETVAGYIAIATQAETNTGTNDTKAVTPLKLKTFVDAQGFTKKFAVALEDAQASVVRTFAGGETSYAVTHGFTSTTPIVSVYRISTGAEVGADVIVTSSTVVTVKFNGNSTDNTFRVVIVA